MGDAYQWVKVIHVLAVISWMAGLFYLPRLFVYHAEKGGDSSIGEVFCVMERRLLAAIMRPAAFVTVVSGVGLAWIGGWLAAVAGWLWLKGLLVVALVVFHGVLEWHCGRFRRGAETRSGRYFRVLNEVPTVLLIGIVICVVVKPF